MPMLSEAHKRYGISAMRQAGIQPIET